MRVVQPAREAERLEARIRVREEVPEFIVLEGLRDLARRGVDHQPRAAEMIRNDAVRLTTLDHIVRHIDARGVHEATHDVAGAVDLREEFPVRRESLWLRKQNKVKNLSN